MSEQTEKNKQLIRDAFAAIFDSLNNSEEMVSRFFHKNYQQYVDGKTLDYQGFTHHLTALFNQLKTCQITFKHIVAEHDKICTVHHATAIKKNGLTVKAQVNALFQVKDDKIILCDELTRILEGEKSDENLGSVT